MLDMSADKTLPLAKTYAMRTVIHLKYVATILLLVLLAISVNGVHTDIHARQHHLTVTDAQASLSSDAAHSCPCTPDEQHNDCDECDSCIHCACHAPLTVQTFQLRYAPLIITLSATDPFKHLPEVVLPKFIPPQNHA